MWMVAGLISALIAAGIGLSLLLAQRARAAASDALRAMERDLANGSLTEDEARQARAELAGHRTAGAIGGLIPEPALVLAAAAFALVAIFGFYRAFVAPDRAELSPEARIALIEAARAGRPNQEAAEAAAALSEETRQDVNPERAAFVAQLRRDVERNPDDSEALGLLALEEARLGNFRAARRAQTRLIDLLGDAANAGHYLELAEIQFLAAGGYVSPETEALLQEVLRRAPGNGAAQYYMGLMYAQQGRPDLGYPIWRDLLAASEPGDPWIGPIRDRIEEVAALAGDPISVEDLFQPPEYELPGPSASEIETALARDSGQGDETLETMVADLAERLSNLGGPPEDWVQLISGFLALDQASAAQSVYDRALIVFAGSDAALAMIEAAGASLEASE